MKRSIIFALAAALAVAGCDALDQSGPEPAGPPVVARVAVSPESTVVQIGKTIQLNAAVTSEDGRIINNRTVDWFSYDGSVAKVDAAGTVTGVSPGTATITASVDGKRGSSRVIVGGSTSGITITSISPNPIVEGETATIYGSNLSSVATNGGVFVDGAKANITGVSATAIQFTVPLSGCKPQRQVDVQVRLSGATSSTLKAVIRPASLINIAVGQQVLLRDPSQLCLQFGASNSTEAYLIGVQSIDEQVKNVTPVTVALTGAPSGNVVAAPAPLPDVNLIRRSSPVDIQDWASRSKRDQALAGEAFLRAQDQQLIQRFRRDGALRMNVASSLAPAVRAGLRVGDQVSLRVAGSTGPCSVAAPITASVRLITNRTIWLEDTANPSGGYTLADLQILANFLENVAYDIDVSYLGAPSDIDGNGKIAVVVTQEVNKKGLRYDPTFNFGAEVRAADYFAPSYCGSSNEGEIIYMRTPDPAGRIGRPTDVAADEVKTLTQLMPHEFSHVMQFGYMILAGGALQPFWIGEAQATLVEELTGHRVTGRTTYQNYGYDVAFEERDKVPWYRGVQWASYYYGFVSRSAQRATGAPEQCSWIGLVSEGNTGPCTANDNIAYGVGFVFLRWLSDQFGAALAGGEKALHRPLAYSNTAGFANISKTVGVPIDSLLAQWAAALYVDDRVPNLNKRLTFTSWNMYDVESRKPPQAQLTPRERSFGTFTDNVNIRAGSTAYFRVSGVGHPSAAIRAVDPGGGALPSTMRMWVVRLQ
jgi:Bacterial Ig-like domain (group 2)/IPT/TIG domain